jgi:hypothetical protein
MCTKLKSIVRFLTQTERRMLEMKKDWIDQTKGIPVMLPGILLMLCALIVFALPASAAQLTKTAKPCKPVGPVNSSDGTVYEKGQYGGKFEYINFKQDQLYDGDDKVDFAPPQNGQKGKKCYERTTEEYRLTVRAGIFDNIDARLIIPFFNKEMKRQSFSQDFTDENSGIGDIKLIGRYRIWSQKKKDPCNLAFGVGLKMPTGSTDEKDSSGNYPGFIQTGSGSWDPIIELGAHKLIGRSFLSSHFLYKMTTKGKLDNDDYEKPDVFKYNFGYAYALSKLFDLQLELNGEVKGKAELAGQKQDNTGGHVIYLSPGVHFKFHKGMHFDVCVPIPVYRDLNGPQLSEDYRMVAKLAMKF